MCTPSLGVLQISDECKIASSVSDVLEIDHTAIDLSPAHYVSGKDRFIQQYGGLDIFVQSAAGYAFARAAKQIDKHRVIDTGLALDIYLRGSYPENTKYSIPQTYLRQEIMEQSPELEYSNWFQFVEQNRVFSLLALRQALHREYFDDRYSMYSYENYFLMQSIQRQNRNNLSEYVDLLKIAWNNTLDIPIQSTMQPITLPLNEWYSAQEIQLKKEQNALISFRSSGIPAFHNRYYSDFDMWFRSSQDWQRALDCLALSDAPIYEYVDSVKVEDIIKRHMECEGSFFSEMIQLITIAEFLSYNSES